MRTFTVDEAQALLPVLESLLKHARECKQAADAVEGRLTELARRIYFSGGMKVDPNWIASQRAEREEHLKRVRETLAEIDAIGVQVKDLDTGLLDFPCRLEEEIVLLCWRLGEPAIEFWHSTEEGVQGRQPLDERFHRRSSGRHPN
jgi:hypothetical protein